MAHRTQILKYMYSVAKFQVTIILYINVCLVKSEEANTKKVTPCRNRTCSVPCLGLWQRIYSHMRLSIWILRYLSPKLERAPQGVPFRTHCLGGLCGVLKVSWCRAGHYRSAWDLRLQEALGSCSICQMQDYILQQGCSNSAKMHVIPNISASTDLCLQTWASLEHFQILALPSAPFVPNL